MGNPCQCPNLTGSQIGHGYAGTAPMGVGPTIGHCIDCGHRYHGNGACGWPTECDTCGHTGHRGSPCVVCVIKSSQSPDLPLAKPVGEWCRERWSSREQRLVSAWHREFGVAVEARPRFPPLELARLRARLIMEEAREAELALQAEPHDGALEAIAKELADLLYVVYGTAVSLGIDLQPVFEEVHQSNLTKTPGNKREDGKVLKGPHYVPPDIKTVLANQEGQRCQ